MERTRSQPENLLSRTLDYTPESYEAFTPLTTFRHLGVNERLVPQKTPAYFEVLSSSERAEGGGVPAERHQNLVVTLSDERPSVGRRIVLEVPAGGRHVLVLRLESPDLTESGLSVLDLDVRAAEGSKLSVYYVQRFPQQVDAEAKIRLHLAENAKAELILADFGAKTQQLDFKAELGDGADLQVGAVYFAAEDQIYDYNYLLQHRGAASVSDLTARGALKDTARKTFRYTLDFLKGSHGSKGVEAEEVTLLNEGVSNTSAPYLLSKEDDVEGTHAASIGRLEEDALFYLMTRGFTREEAERMLILARFSTILDRWPAGDLRNEIIEELTKKVIRDDA